MKKVLKHLKPFVGTIFLAFTLLFVQAVCDLALPDYMSDIVDVGIQNGGVENAVPEVIRESELDKIMMFISDDDKELVKNSYTLLSKDNLSTEEYEKNIEDYPSIENENIYKLNDKNEEEIAELNSILGKAIIVKAGIDSGTVTEMMSQNQGSAPTGNTMPLTEDGEVDHFQIFMNIPEEQRASIVEQIDTEIASMQEMMITQGAVMSVKQEYEAIGIDLDTLQTNYIFNVGFKMVAISLVSMVATILVGFLAAKVAAGFGRNLRKGVFNKVMDFSNSEFDKFSTATLITRSTNDIQQIQMLMVMLIRIVFYAPIVGAGGILKVTSTETGMGWIIALAVMMLMSVVLTMFAFVLPKFKVVQKQLDKLNLVTRESLTGMLVIRAFSTQKKEEEKFESANKDLTRTNLFVNRFMVMMMPIMMFIMNSITLLIVWVSANRINDGLLQVGDMMAFIQYAMQIIMSFLMISFVSIMLPRAVASGQRIDEILSTEITVKDSETTKTFSNNKKGVVEFKNVTFKYPGADEAVLENITFTAKPGETTAFIGSTGSGKSTLINLIPRFYDVTEGEILINGVDIKDVRQHDLREKIGYVPQKGILFSGTIESNLKYGNEELNQVGLERAAEIAQAKDFIASKEEGYNTEISQGGTNVSGGQKQRLSIARALAKNPEIFIFDDSFSALDFKTDAALRKALKAETENSTVLIVAQRISTIRNAEQIIVLDEGKVVGMGTHNELIKNCEVYNQIASSQLSKEELENE